MPGQTLTSSANYGVCTWWKADTFDNPIRKVIHPQYDGLLKEF